MERASINEQEQEVKQLIGIPLFTDRLFKRRIRDCPNLKIGEIIRTQNTIRIK